MKFMITGHRREKLGSYDIDWIRGQIETAIMYLMERGYSYGLSGMASGVDLWFCEVCGELGIPYEACLPFEGQENYMGGEDQLLREQLISLSVRVSKVRNHYMVERARAAIIVWDGNKGGTHNCFQQLLETPKLLYWIVPPRKSIVIIT